jgi:Zn-dependent metalloprotease
MKPVITPLVPPAALCRTVGARPPRRMGRTLEQIVTLSYLSNRLRINSPSARGGDLAPASSHFMPPARRTFARVFAAGLLSLIVSSAPAQSNQLAEENLGRLMSSMRASDERGATPPPRAEEPMRVTFGAGQKLTHLAAAPGHAFPPEQKVPGQPAATARLFAQGNFQLLGLSSTNVDLQPSLTRQSAQRHFVRFQQTYAGVPVFAGQMAIQLNQSLDVEFMSADLALEVNALDAESQWTTPTVSAAQAAEIISNQTATASPGVTFSTTTPQLMIFAPSVFDESGPAQLVWDLKLYSDPEPELNARWLVDAKSGAVLRRYALTHSALEREVRDSNNTTNWPGTLVRAEGDPATGIADVDNAYLFLGQIYNFFNNNFGMDSYDNNGITLNATVRYCPNPTNCPWGNAQWTGTRMRFGTGFATDDVTAHEYTHAITEFSSGLIYENASGAINESLSDIFGEFVDLSNANGNDAANVRWLIGEDLPGGSIRDMSFPTNRNDPDRLGSAFYIPPVPAGTGNNGNDFGGVHSNSGVNNKLAYLLTDGDAFNGQTVTGMGINPVAALYHEANVNLLTAGANWTDLYEALRQASVNLGWNVDQRNNLYRACRAVEIAASEDLYVDWTSNCLIKNGRQTCLIFVGGPFQTVAQGNSGAHPGDRLHIRGGSYDESVTLQKIMTVRAYDGTAVIGN